MKTHRIDEQSVYHYYIEEKFQWQNNVPWKKWNTVSQGCSKYSILHDYVIAGGSSFCSQLTPNNFNVMVFLSIIMFYFAIFRCYLLEA